LPCERKSLPDAVAPFVRMQDRNHPAPDAVIFGPVQRELMNTTG
jgi:hypothetical protein